MTRKIIIVLLIILILTIILQVNNTEYMSGDNPDDIYTSNEFNMLSKSNNLENVSSFQDAEANIILDEYMNLPYNDMLSKHQFYKNKLFDHFLLKEENSINTTLGASNTKYIYLTISAPNSSDYFNKAGENIRKINGDIYVWQPLSYWMLSKGESGLISKINPNADSPYIECWHLEKLRSGSLGITQKIQDNYINSRPKGSDILSYENNNYDFTYLSKNKIRTGNQEIRYIGKRADNPGRVFDQRGPNMSSGNSAYNEVRNSNYNNYYNNYNYKKYIRNSVDWLNGNVKCFGLQWQAGELFYSENDEICDRIENLPEHSHGWPHAWAFNFYRIEEANDIINDNTYRENANLTVTEAKTRRINIRRSDNSILILKQDL